MLCLKRLDELWEIDMQGMAVGATRKQLFNRKAKEGEFWFPAF